MQVMLGPTIGPRGEFLIARVPKGTLQNTRQADSLRQAVRTNLAPEATDIEVVVMDGEPGDKPLLSGPVDLMEHVRRNLPIIATTRYFWKPLELK
jgi:hypothetical protein